MAVRKTWAGPIRSQIYGDGLLDLCKSTENNLIRLKNQFGKMDPCLEYGVKHWHPEGRPSSAPPVRVEKVKSDAKWENTSVMFTGADVIKSLERRDPEPSEDGSYIGLTGPPNKFCVLCSSLEEHQRHLLLHKPRKRPATAKPRIHYIAPRPKQKKKEEDEDLPFVPERLYKVDVFTMDEPNAGTTANVYVTIKGSLGLLPKTQLKKRRGSSKFHLSQGSKETFHIKGPNLGNLQILSIEHDGMEKKHAWYLDKVEITDVKGMKCWVFLCKDWLCMYEGPHYSNKRDIQAESKDTPLTDYVIDVQTGKKRFAGTDAKVFITLFGTLGISKKIHLVDNTKGKKLFEQNSLDQFRIRMHGIGELKKIKVEHDGAGIAAGWYLDSITIAASDRPRDRYYFMYHGWLAKDKGDGRLWREIKAKKTLPKEVIHGSIVKYHVMVKTGDVRYAGTDANVFIQMVGPRGTTKKLKMDDAKNNFERNMVDNFELEAPSVGPLTGIIIGHDNSGPGAGWFLDHVKVRRYVPRDEALAYLKKAKKQIKLKRQKKLNKDLDGMDDVDRDLYRLSMKEKEQKCKAAKEKKKKKKSITKGSDSSSSSESESESDSETEDRDWRKRERRRSGSTDVDSRRKSVQSRSGSADRRGSRPGSAIKRPGSAVSWDRERDSERPRSAMSRNRDREKRRRNRKDEEDEEDEISDLKVPLYEEYLFKCNQWLASDEADGLCVRELEVSDKNTYFKT